MFISNARTYDPTDCTFYHYRKPVDKLNFLVCVIDIDLPKTIATVQPIPDEEIKGLLIGGLSSVNPPRIFDNFNKVTYYGILRHQVETISIENFSDCLWLEGLDISNGKLKKIEFDSLQDLGRLRDIDFSKNELDYIHPKTFVNLANLEKLNLSYNKLFAVELETFTKNRKLNMLDLRNNKIVTIAPRALDGVNSLRELYFAGNTCINMDLKPPRVSALRLTFSQSCRETPEILETLQQRRDDFEEYEL